LKDKRKEPRISKPLNGIIDAKKAASHFYLVMLKRGKKQDIKFTILGIKSGMISAFPVVSDEVTPIPVEFCSLRYKAYKHPTRAPPKWAICPPALLIGIFAKSIIINKAPKIHKGNENIPNK